jgi:hypothetical protein
MANPVNAKVGCELAGDYVDEAECPTNLAFHKGDVVRPQLVGNYVDFWGADGDIKTPKKEDPKNDTPEPN